jgi:hypothetical protein
MIQIAQKALAPFVLAFSTLFSGPAAAAQQPVARLEAQEGSYVQRRIPPAARRDSSAFARTELYFGTAKPGGVVTEEEFRDFVDAYVTPLFPDGLTLLKGEGQFRGEDGVIVKEQSFILILLYPFESFEASSQRIQSLRGLYKSLHEQESVLRVDDPFVVWVSF